MDAAIATSGVKAADGGSFLIEELRPDEVFTLEDLTEEQQEIARLTASFAGQEVLPAIAEIEAKNFAVTRGLLQKAAGLGLMGVDVPEAYGGLEMDKVTSALIADNIAVCGSFSVAFSAHVGIGTLPLVWYGTPAQKEKYLPRLVSGEWIAAYALSESSSGSDAMNIRTQAALSADGTRYVLNGEKMWISNAGFADLFIVFAKVDGDKFSAFLVERSTQGLTVGAEEHKLGIRGSSTCPLVLSECAVPVENLLGEAGKGHKIAFNILNVGRYKLGAAALGGAREALRNGVRYAKERMAFGKPIASFGLVQEKIARCAAAIYAGESLVYRVVGAIDASLAGLDKGSADFAQEVQKRIEGYAVECSILKVWGSEMLDRVADEMVQIYGGYGYVEEYPAERFYRDARINRIFEGTNEINRLIITGWILKRAAQGRLALMPAVQKVMDEVMAGPVAREEREGETAWARGLLASMKKIALFASGAAFQKFGPALAEEQEVMGALANVLIEVLTLESTLLRTEKMAGRNALAVKMANYYAAEAFRTVEAAAEQVLGAAAEGDMLQTQRAILRRLSKHEGANTVALGREIALAVTEAGRYLV
jgi:butyryl-CoA dehydrogenase